MIAMSSRIWVDMLMLAISPVDVEVRLSKDVALFYPHIPAAVQDDADTAFQSRDPNAEVAIVIDVRFGRNILFEADMSAAEYPELDTVRYVCDQHEKCNTEKFIRTTIAQIDAFLQQVDKVDQRRLELAQEEKAHQLDSQEVSETIEAVPQQTVIDHPDEARHPERTLVVSGAAVLSVGIAATVTGGVLLGQARQGEDQDWGSGEQTGKEFVYASSWLYEHQAAPLGILLSGAVLTATGVTLVTIGTVRRNRRKSSLSLAPAVGGIVFSGAF